MSGLPAAVLVDQDGTVVDTEPVWKRCEARLLAEMGGVLTPEMRVDMVGGPLRRTVSVMIEHAVDKRPIEDVEEDLIAAVASIISEGGAPWMPTTELFMTRVKALGLPIGLVTSSWSRIARAVAAQAPAGGFDLVIAGDEIARPKPEPDGYLEAARRLGVAIEDCVIVEDSPTGLTAAVASGARVVAIPNELPVPESRDYSRFNSLDELDEGVLRRIAAGETIDIYND